MSKETSNLAEENYKIAKTTEKFESLVDLQKDMQEELNEAKKNWMK